MSGNKAYQQRRPAPLPFDVATERAAFVRYILDPAMKAEYSKLLGPDIDVDRFVSTAIDLVEQKPDLLNPEFRSSLFFSLKKAAKQGLKPDGKEGALVPRYDNDAKCRVVQWQPMVQGIMKAGRRAGALRKLVADLVFAGEIFRFTRGDEEKIEHIQDMEVRSAAYQKLRPKPTDGYDGEEGTKIDIDGFWEQVVGAYCVIEAPDGTKTRRAMPRERLLNLRDFAKSKSGPWHSVWVDEMITKAVILYTAKHIETDASDVHKMTAFRDAMEQDMMDGDFEEGRNRTIEHVPPKPALASPSSSLDRLSQQLMARKTQAGVQHARVEHQDVATDPPADLAGDPRTDPRTDHPATIKTDIRTDPKAALHLDPEADEDMKFGNGVVARFDASQTKEQLAEASKSIDRETIARLRLEREDVMALIDSAYLRAKDRTQKESGPVA